MSDEYCFNLIFRQYFPPLFRIFLFLTVYFSAVYLFLFVWFQCFGFCGSNVLVGIHVLSSADFDILISGIWLSVSACFCDNVMAILKAVWSWAAW